MSSMATTTTTAEDFANGDGVRSTSSKGDRSP